MLAQSPSRQFVPHHNPGKRQRRLKLTPEQRAELEHMCEHAPKGYLRERAATVLEIADGEIAFRLAQFRLGRSPDTVYAWLDRYEAEGIKGLYNRPGRGRKPKNRNVTPAAANS